MNTGKPAAALVALLETEPGIDCAPLIPGLLADLDFILDRII
jgi:hypothetical protein